MSAGYTDPTKVPADILGMMKRTFHLLGSTASLAVTCCPG
jgi:hypothetical protein